MAINDRLEKIARTFLAQQHGAIAEALNTQAKEISRINEDITATEKKKAERAALLEQHKTDIEVVKFVEAQAAAMQTGIDKYLATMPEAFRLMYQTSAEKIKQFTEEGKEKGTPVDIDLCITATDSKVFLYIPVLWEERQKPVIPGKIYTSSVIAMTQIAKDLKGKQDEPRPINDVVMQLVSDIDGMRGVSMLEDVLSTIAGRGRELEGERLRINTSMLKQHVWALKGDTIPTEERAAATATEKTYTLEEAALAWREHEVKNGTVNGDEGNYKMKLGARVKEGRLRQTEQGITQGALEDFIKYATVKKNLYGATAQNRKIATREETQKLMMMDKDQLDAYTKSEELFERKGQITIDMMIRFTQSHTIVDGRWTKFKSQLRHEIRRAEQEITKPRDAYVTSKEAEKLFGLSSIQILKRAKEGAFKTYYSGPVRTHFLFDKEELTNYFQDNR